jgi:hypothetical protein
MAKIYCAVCGKQAVPGQVPVYDKYVCPLEGAKANFGNTVFCGHCAKDLDENGLFPEERSGLEN